jgi:hypothetical protein
MEQKDDHTMVDKILEFISDASLIAFASSIASLLLCIWSLYSTVKIRNKITRNIKEIQRKRQRIKRILEYVGNVDVKEGND